MSLLIVKTLNFKHMNFKDLQAQELFVDSLFREGKYQQVIDFEEKLRNNEVSSTKIYLLISKAKFNLGLSKGSLETIENGLAYSKNDFGLQEFKNTILLKLDKNQEAFDVTKDLLQKNSKNLKSYILHIRNMLLFDQYNEARNLLLSKINEYPKHLSLLELMIQIEEKSGNIFKALNWCEILRERLPGDFRGCYRKGLLLVKQQQYEKAFEAFQAGLEIAPNHPGIVQHMINISVRIHTISQTLEFISPFSSNRELYIYGIVTLCLSAINKGKITLIEDIFHKAALQDCLDPEIVSLKCDYYCAQKKLNNSFDISIKLLKETVEKNREVLNNNSALPNLEDDLSWVGQIYINKLASVFKKQTNYHKPISLALDFYVQEYLRNSHFPSLVNNEPNRQSKQKFVFCFNTPALGLSSSHASIQSNILNTFIESNYECHVLFVNHPFTFGVIEKNNLALLRTRGLTDHSSDFITSKVKETFSKVGATNPYDYSITVLNDSTNTSITLDILIQRVFELFAKLNINKNDLVIAYGDHNLGSSILHRILKQVNCSKSFYMSANICDPTIFEASYSYILSPTPKLHSGASIPVLQGPVIRKPFCWETSFNKVNLLAEELQCLNGLVKLPNAFLAITTAKNLHTRVDCEYIDFIKRILTDFDNCHLLLIGTSHLSMSTWHPEIATINNKITYLNFAKHLFTLYTEIAKALKCVYIYPQHNGGGGGNILAALAGVPVFVFKNNDAQPCLSSQSIVTSYNELYSKFISCQQSDVYRKEVVEMNWSAINNFNIQSKAALLNLPFQ